MPAESVIVDLSEGDRLSDLCGIDNDLISCKDYILLYKTLCFLKVSHITNQLTDCIITTIFIKYGRCFSGGVRLKTQKELKLIMDAEDLKVHQLAIDFRDKHFAHSVNQCESPEIVVWLRTSFNDREVTSVDAASTYMLAPNILVLENMVILIDKLHAWVVSEKKLESEKLLKIVKKRLSLEFLYTCLGAKTKKQI